MKFDENQKKELKKLILEQFYKTLEICGEYFDSESVQESLEAQGFRVNYFKRNKYKDTKNWVHIRIDSIDVIHFFGRPSKIDSALNYNKKTTYAFNKLDILIPKDIAFKALTLKYFAYPEKWGNITKDFFKWIMTDEGQKWFKFNNTHELNKTRN